MLVVSIIVGGTLVLVLGLSCIGMKLAKDLNEQDNPKPVKKELTSHQKSEMNRISVLLEAAGREDKQETGNILHGYYYTASDNNKNAKRLRKEAHKIAKKARIEIEE
ncbi:MAG: hypothetical protein PHC68_09195 [Syntrophorhabdaceae bacterium]|nr:hypothetical protein [Syntrophorhabdaceae bacterium]